MRRKGTACETAHCMVPPVGVTEKPSAARQKVQVALLCGQAGVGVDVAGDVDGVGRSAEAEDLRVEADGDVDVIVAGEKEERVALGAEFAVLLDGVDLVDLLLDCAEGMDGFEDENVGAEVRLCALSSFSQALAHSRRLRHRTAC